MTITEADTIAGWAHYYRALQTPEARSAFLLWLDPDIAAKLLKRLRIHSAVDLMRALRGKTVVAIR